MKNRIISILLLLLTFSLSGYAQKVMTLEDFQRSALMSSAKVKNARLDIEAAESDRSMALSKYFPKVDVSAFSFWAHKPLLRYGIDDIEDEAIRSELNDIWENWFESRGVSRELSFIKDGSSIAATAVQPIFMGGQIVNGNALARLGVDAAQKQALISEKDILYEVEKTYLQAISLQETKHALEESLSLVDSLYDCLVDASNAGVATRRDTVKLSIRRAELSSGLQTVEEGITLAKLALCVISGVQYSPSIELFSADEIELSEPSSLYYDPSDAVFNRPEYALLRMNVQSEMLQKKMAIGAALPQVALGAGYAYSNVFGDSWRDNALLFVSVKVPITLWWENSIKIRKGQIRIDKAQNLLDESASLLEVQTMKCWSELQKCWRDLLLADLTLEDARDAYEMQKTDYEAGLKSLTDLMQSELELQQALVSHTDARIAYRLKAAEYRNLTR